MRILIAEDENATALILTRVLERRGHSVVRATDGASAFETLQNAGPFDVVVTDWMLPRMAGVGFIRKARSELSNLPPIVVLTALASDDARYLVLDAGADDYLTTPIQPAELIQCLASCVARHTQSGTYKPAPPTEALAVGALFSVPLVGIVAGAGGPVAIQKLFRRSLLAKDGSFVVVQHGPRWLLEAFAVKLQGQCSLRVAVASAGVRFEPGTIWIAPGGKHVQVAADGERLQLSDLPEENFVCPAGDVLFRSMVSRARSSLAVVLTGLGRDGAVGASRLLGAGGKVIIQHSATAEVDAMPQAAAAACGGHDSVLLPDIPGQLDLFIHSVKQAFDRSLVDSLMVGNDVTALRQRA